MGIGHGWIMAPPLGLEPRSTVLEAVILPLDEGDKLGGSLREPIGAVFLPYSHQSQDWT